jgi:hypothetical protein
MAHCRCPFKNSPEGGDQQLIDSLLVSVYMKDIGPHPQLNGPLQVSVHLTDGDQQLNDPLLVSVHLKDSDPQLNDPLLFPVYLTDADPPPPPAE